MATWTAPTSSSSPTGCGGRRSSGRRSRRSRKASPTSPSRTRTRSRPQRRAPGRGRRGGQRAQGRADLAADAAAPRGGRAGLRGAARRHVRRGRRRDRARDDAAAPGRGGDGVRHGADLAGPGVEVADALVAIAGACRRSRSWTAGSRTGACGWSTRSRTMHRRPGGPRRQPYSGHGAGPATARGVVSRNGSRSTAAPVRRRSATRPGAWPGWRTSWAGSARDCAAATSCCPERCTGWRRPVPATSTARFAHLGTVTTRFGGGGRMTDPRPSPPP